jgi:hypothetical protein
MLDRFVTLVLVGPIAALIAGAMLPAGAEEVAMSEDNIPPTPLIRYLFAFSPPRDLYRESYLHMVMTEFRTFAGADQVLDGSDVDLLVAAFSAGYRAAIVDRIMRNDLNADGVVTEEELRRVDLVFPGGPSGHIDGRVRGYLAADGNDDGSISTEEAHSFASRRQLPDRGRSLSRAEEERQLIALDSDGDGRLTVIELDAAARTAFARFDLNGDGRLVQSEVMPWRSEAYGWLSQPDDILARCKLPELSKDAQLVLLFGPDSDTLSDVSVVGPDIETNAQKLVVRDGDKPIYVVAPSGWPIVWQLTGSIDRVERFVATSLHVDGRRGGTGVAGLDARKVSFVDAGCLESVYRGDPVSALGSVLKRRVGRDVDEIVLGPHGAKIMRAYSSGGNSGITDASGSAITFVSDRPKRLEEYSSRVDGGTYADFVRFNPGGVAHLDPTRVVSDGQVVAYPVLPQEAGLLQLVDNGALQRAGRAFRIVKPIERFPPGLTARRKVQFTLAKGIPMPKGNPGHSSVTSEETGEMLVDSGTRPMSIDPFDDLGRWSDGRF